MWIWLNRMSKIRVYSGLFLLWKSFGKLRWSCGATVGCRCGFLTSCWVNFTSTPMLQILNEIKNNMIKLWSQSTIKNQDYISLYVIEIKNSRLHLIACNRNERSASHASHTARHFMHHFTSFHVVFRIISCHISYISLHTSHTLHTSLHRMSSHFSYSRIMNYFALK